jgi:hypothetical protein
VFGYSSKWVCRVICKNVIVSSLLLAFVHYHIRGLSAIAFLDNLLDKFLSFIRTLIVKPANMKNMFLTLSFIAVSVAVYAQTNTVRENPVLIGQERGFTVSKASLAIDPVLRMPDARKDYYITGYNISYVSKDTPSDLLGPFKIKGNDMTTGMAAEILNRAQPGDRIFFEDIVAVSSEAGKPPLKLVSSIKIR